LGYGTRKGSFPWFVVIAWFVYSLEN